MLIKFNLLSIILLLLISFGFITLTGLKWPLYSYNALLFSLYGAFIYVLMKFKYIGEIGSVIFVLISLAYWGGYNVNRLFIVSSALFFFLMICKYLKKMFIIQIIGKYSLMIYLFHVLVYNLLEQIIPHNVLWGVITYVLTILICVCLALLLVHNKYMRILIFPKTIGEYKKLFTK